MTIKISEAFQRSFFPRYKQKMHISAAHNHISKTSEYRYFPVQENYVCGYASVSITIIYNQGKKILEKDIER